MAKDVNKMRDGEFASYIADLTSAYDALDYQTYNILLDTHTSNEKDREWIEELVTNHSYIMLLTDFF